MKIFCPLITSADSCSFLFLSSTIFPLFSNYCNFMWFVKLRASAGMCGVCARISSYCLKSTAIVFNLFQICSNTICFFIGKSENAIWDPWLQKKNRGFFAQNGAVKMAAGVTSNFVFWTQRSQMAFSNFQMKKQIVFGQIWKKLVMIVVNLNYYEFALVCTIYSNR